MNDLNSIVIERFLPHSSSKIWRALTETNLLEQWLMKNDFSPVVGEKFQLRRASMPGWDGITNCEVISLEQEQKLVYTWNPTGDRGADELRTLVTWTLTPVDGGTMLRMEQSGFKASQADAQGGAEYGWTMFIGKLEQLLTAL